MKEIIIGKNGNQPFPITAEGVSSKHASLIIKDNGVMILKDLNSTNGTYIRNNNYKFERIGEKIISSDTIIRLGDETINGMTFMALQLIKENPNDYTYEFRELKKQWKQLSKEKEKLEKRTILLSFLPMLISTICIAITLTPVFDNISGPNQMRLMRLLMIVPSFTSPILNYVGKKGIKQLGLKMSNILRCPNPKCGRQLTETEIIKMQCAACKVHG